jgi:phosphatidylserine/phosphatidylglycerophosphate/cardiolipin synthase-like enzyme
MGPRTHADPCGKAYPRWVKILGAAAFALLLAAAPSSPAAASDIWSSAFPIPLPGLPVPRPPAPPAPSVAALPPVPVVVFHGLSIAGVQFSRTGRIPVSLAAAIDKTSRTLRLSIYDLRLPDVASALLRAKARGVDVRLVYDDSHTTPASPEYQSLLAGGIPVRILKGAGSFGIMHNKFAVFDGELLATGSFNWTDSADQKNFENAIFRSDASLAEGYTKYWDWMWALARDPAAPSAAPKPGAPPADPATPVAFAGGRYPRYAFSPQGGLEDLLVDAIGRSKRTIDVAIFSLYSQRVVDALIAAKGRGVAVRVAADVSQTRRSQPMLALSKSGAGVRLSSGPGGGGVLHHKFVLFDGVLLMTGSYNFSANAELYNFENDLFSTVPGEAAAYGAEFAAVWDQAHAPADGELPAPKSL